MPKLGVSVYPDLSPLSEIEEYLKLAGKYGARRVFSSMFSVEGTPEEILDYFRRMNSIAHENGMEVSLDVNTEFLEKIGVSPTDISRFHEIGCDIIRMDGCYGDERDIELINNPYGIKIEFNASAVPELIQDLLKKGANPERLLACHNFYPQPYTGMKWGKFQDVNQKIKDIHDIPIGAFISSNAEGTNGVWDAQYGLPTVERMRDYPADLQARLLLATGNVDDIFFGNYYADEQELKDVSEVLKPRDLEVPPALEIYAPQAAERPQRILKIKLDPEISEAERQSLFAFMPHTDMGDASEWIWRSRLPRMVYKDTAFTPRKAEKEMFEPGDVLIVNDNYKHYAGEVQIALLPMKNDGLRNLVGHIEGPEMDMLELIKPYDVVFFEEDK